MRNIEEELKILLENSPLGIALADATGKFRYVNSSFCKMLGYETEELTSMSVREITHPDAFEESAQAIKDITSRKQKTIAIKKRYQHKNGSTIIAITRLACVFDEAGKPQYMCTTIENITEQKRTQDYLSNTLKRAETILKTAMDGVIEFDETGTIIRCNDMAEHIFGIYSETLKQLNITSLISPNTDDTNSFDAWLQKNHTSGRSDKFYGIHKNTGQFPIEISVTSYFEGDNRLYSLFVRDITERKLAEQKQRHFATHDTLTGIPNRLLFMEVLEHITAASSRKKAQHALLFLDLDNFKNINDAMGHHIGDLLLKQVASRIRRTVRSGDSIARIGGDEFTVLLNDIKDEKNIHKIAKKIINVMAEPFELNDSEVYISSSIGIAQYPHHGRCSEVLLRNADIAMYKAKQQGKNNYLLFDKVMDKTYSRKLSLESRLRHAIKNDQLAIHYQPKICFKQMEVSGFEALVRWPTPEEKFISPGEFIPIAEETGLIVPLGHYILEKVCQETRDLYKHQHLKGRVAVNVSTMQFSQRSFFQEVESILKNNAFEPNWLELEITESAVIHDFESSSQLIEKLRHNGMSMAMDDFGTGYSSLSYLQRLPVDVLKIDKSFIDNIAHSQQAMDTVKFIIQLAHNLNLEVVAEGIEHQEQALLLGSINCDTAQGFYFAKPTDLNTALQADVMNSAGMIAYRDAYHNMNNRRSA